ncbi:MAG: dihydrofolate reductase family protein [Thermoleophilaceae bacterium]|nr:dihydrofolate reductase family protein [Thermoleophilaceae bacterium]
MSEFSGHVFIGVSVDGFIARSDGDLKWLTERDLPVEESGYNEFMDGVDVVIMGRTTYETVVAMDEWPYTIPVFVLSSTLDPGSIQRDDVSVHRSIDAVLVAFASAGFANACVDGGATIRSFLRLGLIDSMTLSIAPVLIGSGAPLFGDLVTDVDLELESTKALPAGFVQTRYHVAR